MSWEDWFGFNNDPFDPKPLQTEEQFRELLVRTKPISDRIEPLMQRITNESFCKGVLGSRGTGKSTVLRYCCYLASKNKAIPILVQFHPAGLAKSRVPVYEILLDIMTQIIQQLVINLYEIKPDLFQKNKEIFMKSAEYVGLNYDRIDGFYRDPFTFPPPDEKLLRRILWGILDVLKRKQIHGLVAIDNLDKLPFDVAKNFLGGMVAQPLFEYLLDSGSSIIISVDPEIEERIRYESDFSYFGERIKLSSLSPSEAIQLINDRITYEHSTKLNANCVFVEDELINRVCIEKKGITREVLKEFSKLFQMAYERTSKLLSSELYDKPIPKISSAIYYEIIDKNPDAKNGAEKLLALIQKLEDNEILIAREFIASLFKGRRRFIPYQILKKLFDCGVLLSTDTEQKIFLHSEVRQFFEEAYSLGIAASDTASWLMKKEIITTVKPKYPTFKSKRLIKRALEIFNKSKKKHGNVSLLIGSKEYNNPVQLHFSDYQKLSIDHLNVALANYDDLENQPWEDINPKDAQNQIYFTLLKFLFSFSYYYILYSKITFFAKSKNNWSMIFSVIKDIQKKHSFKSFSCIEQIRQNKYAMNTKQFQPTLNDINCELQSLEEIIVEIMRIWEIICAPNLIENDTINAERTKLQNTITEFCTDNDWKLIEQSETLDLVASRLQTLISDKKRPQFLLVKTKTDTFPENIDFISFFSDTEKIILALEKEEYSKDYLKPFYHLLFVSTQDFKKKPLLPKLPVPRNRIKIKYIKDDKLVDAFKRMNLVEFLTLDEAVLDSEDIEKFQNIQEEFFLKSPKTATNEAIDYFEEKMRKIIHYTLTYHYCDVWYTSNIIPMKKELDIRFDGEANSIPKSLTVDGTPLDFSFISDLKDIIIKKDNWRECFGVLFNKNKKLQIQFTTRMDEIKDLRNKIRHSREKTFPMPLQNQMRRCIENIVWVLQFMNQYRIVNDYFDPEKVVVVKMLRNNILITSGRLSCKISKQDSDQFDSKIKAMVGNDVFKVGGVVKLNLSSLDEEFELSRKKVLSMLNLCKEQGLAKIYRQNGETYKLHFIPKK